MKYKENEEYFPPPKKKKKMGKRMIVFFVFFFACVQHLPLLFTFPPAAASNVVATLEGRCSQVHTFTRAGFIAASGQRARTRKDDVIRD